jgi:hypothetical protein
LCGYIAVKIVQKFAHGQIRVVAVDRIVVAFPGEDGKLNFLIQQGFVLSDFFALGDQLVDRLAVANYSDVRSVQTFVTFVLIFGEIFS